jgi:hypothetical protein
MSSPLERLEPFIGTAEAGRLAEMVAALPPPESVGDYPPSAEWLDGWREALTLAVAVVMKAGGC